MFSTRSTGVNPHVRLRNTRLSLKIWSLLAASSAVLAGGLLKHSRLAHSDSDHSQGKSTTDRTGKDALDGDESRKSEMINLPWNGLSIMLNSSVSISSISSILSTWTWPSTIRFSGLQEQVSTLLLELGRGPGSLYSDVVHGPPDLSINPECEWDANVRLGDELCLSERAFLRERKRFTKAAFANLLDVPEEKLHEEDLPVVAIAGSGGGYRAMLNTIGSLTGAKSTGLFDCVTYAAGISGSCWSLGLIYSGVAGSHDPSDAGRHAKDRIQLSYLDIATLEALITPPTNKYLLSGILHKAAGSFGSVSLVDIYGTLVASRLFVPSDTTQLDPKHLSLHQFRRNVDNGALPLPIFTAIQHVVPPERAEAIGVESRTSIEARRLSGRGRGSTFDHQSKWLWYEFTPFEAGCDDLGAWIPAWALGRPFKKGKCLDRRPELSLAILSGICASAFCASLKDYFSEVQPTLRQLPPQLYKWLEELTSENEKDLGIIHPVLPDQLPNFLKDMIGLPNGAPEDITQRETLGFMDAGAALNIPYYPLLRRSVDCIIALDASADSQDLWFTRAEELASRRGLRTWPRGARWPVQVRSEKASISTDSQISMTSVDPTAEDANLKLARRQESELSQQTDKRIHSEAEELSEHSISRNVSSCEVWIGSSNSSELDTSLLDDLDEEALLHRDGIGIVYMPLVPNEARVPGFDPATVSTWKREVAPEESQKLLDVAQANFIDGKPKIERLLRAIWLRKKREREAREQDRYDLEHNERLNMHNFHGA